MTAAWHLTDDLHDFGERAEPLLARDPVRHTQALLILAALKQGRRFGEGAPYFAWWGDENGECLGAVVCTPPFPPVVGLVPEGSFQALAETLFAAGVPVSGASGEIGQVQRFGRAWTSVTGLHQRLTAAQRLYSWAEPTPPAQPAPGRARTATIDDLDLLCGWWMAFADEADVRPPLDVTETVRPLIDAALMTIWEGGNGRPVSFAGRRAPEVGMSRIGPVYTPPGDRGRGYASQVTWAASHAARADGAEYVTLFTDLTNPTSNSIYRQLGYRPVFDAAMVGFEDGSARVRSLLARERTAVETLGGRLPLPDLADWGTFPFEGSLQVKRLDAAVIPEPARQGEGGVDCPPCTVSGRAVWTDGQWKLKALRPDGVLALLLEPLAHLDLTDLDATQAARLGVLTVAVARAVEALPGVGRVHVNRYGDGSEHLHIWFFARPLGALQLRGSCLPDWLDVLPPIDDAEWERDLASVAAGLAFELG